MRKSLLSLLLLATLAVAAAGCGGSSGGGGGGGGGGVPSTAVDPAKLANCLNEQDWIASPTGQEVSGNAASGAGIDIHIFDTPAAAKAAAAKHPAKSTAAVGTAMIQFLGTVTPTGPAPPAPINQKDLATIKTCLAASA